MSFYRSDPINHYKLILPRQSAWEIMNKLGQQDLIHIVPSSSPILARPFLSQVKRCEETLQKISTLQSIISEKNIYKPRNSFNSFQLRKLYDHWDQVCKVKHINPIAYVEEINTQVEQNWNYYFDLKKRIQECKNRLNFYRQNEAIIKAGQQFFGRGFFSNNDNRLMEVQNYFPKGPQIASRINYKAGVIKLKDQARFQKTIFRITRGNCMTSCFSFQKIFDKVSQEEKEKAIFFILFPGGGQDNYFENKLERLIHSYSDAEYDLPNSISEFNIKVAKIEAEYKQAAGLLEMLDRQFFEFLGKYADFSNEVSQFRKCEYIKLYLFKQREIYNNLNEMELYNNFLQGSIFVKKTDIQKLQFALQQIEKKQRLPAGQLVPMKTDKFPTSFHKNSYTTSASQIVETYGVPRYKQANPAFFTTITFPFLFGVMFGDIAHGLILFCFGTYLIFQHKNLENSALSLLAPHRYLITMMGLFAFYCGFIYNDFLSISLNIFGSCYSVAGVQPGTAAIRDQNCVYPVGIDPIWSIAENNLNYVNSLKMKLSVILGVIHMTLGVFVKATNALYFKKYIDFFCQFIPQLLFLVLLFGYMDFLIIFKWLINWGYYNSHAPSIITTMINLPLGLGFTGDCCGSQPMWGENSHDTSQNYVQLTFLIISVICIPWMLLPKPIIQIMRLRRIAKNPRQAHEQGNNLLSQDEIQHDKAELLQEKLVVHSANHEGGASEIFVHQMIETIEYVLGCISNTASYLRLWALSLAHSQLSQVFFQKTVQSPISWGYTGIPLMIIAFPILAGATFGVLLCMDSMECFLHTLRLHWVEFQNKFYKGDGFSFVPYSFEDKIEAYLSKNE